MKKQIAILMAAATAVTTVAPVLANADVTTKDSSRDEIVAAAKKALEDKYSDAKADGIRTSVAGDLEESYLNSKYIVLVEKAAVTNKEFKTLKDSAYGKIPTDKEFEVEVEKGKTIKNSSEDWFVVDDANKLGNLLEAKSGLKVSIIDKGSKDGSASLSLKNKHLVLDSAAQFNADQQIKLNTLAKDLVAKTNDAGTKATYVEKLTAKIGANEEVLVDSKTDKKVDLTGKVVTELKLKLTSGKEFTFKVNDEAIDVDKAFDKDGGAIELATSNDQSVFDTVEKFANIENEGGKTAIVDIPMGDTTLYTSNDVTQKDIALNTIYTREEGYTQAGADFVNSLAIRNKAKDYTFNYGGTTYLLNKDAVEGKTLNDGFGLDDAKIERVGDKYVLKFKIKAVDNNDKDRKYDLQFAIDGKTQKDLADVLRDLKGATDVIPGHFKRLIGADRYATAIEVSAAQYDGKFANSVVIVGGKAQLDGLAASPLAAAKNAPILLASPNSGLSAATLDEIKRATNDGLKNKTVYIVGGKASVPESVEKQLEDKFGAVVVRLAGDDRQATSLEVAQRLYYDADVSKGTDAFIVGANGAADAMSIAAVAARTTNGAAVRKVRPIVVASKDGIKKATREFFLKTLNVKDLTLIGGESTISTQVLKDAVETAKGKAERVAGTDRYDTNVKIVNKYYFKDKDIVPTGALFASGKYAYLVDAQTSGAFAASKSLPIILTADKLTADQADLMKKNGVLEDKKSVYQVGGVVSADVMKEVVNLLGL